MNAQRRGTVIILVAGAAALMATLVLAFLMRMRSDGEESNHVVRDTQARIMLLAACGYVLEAGRLGYDIDPQLADPAPHEEAYGWIDVRDGSTGPKDRNGTALYSSGWPAVGGTAICPMHLWQRPPWAIRTTVVYNPIDLDKSRTDWGYPYLTRPDPQPAVDNNWPTLVDDSRYGDFAAGDARPRPTSTGMSWFRVHRESAARFVVTCGAGATNGYADWNEVQTLGRTDEFGNDQAAFDDARVGEQRLWYRIEWSAAVAPSDYHYYDNELRETHVVDQYFFHPMNSSQTSPSRSIRSQMRCPNFVGTIRWVQRLWEPPTVW